MKPFVAALLAELEDDDEGKRELAGALRPYLHAQSDQGSEQLLDAAGKAAQLGLHRDTLARMARTGRIEALKIGREWRYREGDLPEGRRGVRVARIDASARRRPPKLPASVEAIRGR